jgi:hypothetical protein
MGVRPPSDDVDDTPEVVEFGIPALAARLESRDVSYPADADELARVHGDLRIPVNATGNEVSLADALERSGRESFESERELLDALHPVFEAERSAVSRSILAQLRGLLPF